MGDAEREELLGKRSAEVVGKILQDDREKKYKDKDKKADETFFVFWDTKAAVGCAVSSRGCGQADILLRGQGGEDKVPELLANEQHMPFLKIICNATKRGGG